MHSYRILTSVCTLVILLFPSFQDISAAEEAGSRSRLPYVIVVAAAGLNRDALFEAEKHGRYPALSRMLRSGCYWDTVYAPCPAGPENALAELMCGRPALEVLPARSLLKEGRLIRRGLEDREILRLDNAVETLFHYFPRKGLALELPIAVGAEQARWLNFTVPPEDLRRTHYFPSRELGKEFRWLTYAGLPELTVILLQDTGAAKAGASDSRERLVRELDRLLGMLILRLKEMGRLDQGLLVCVGLPGNPTGKKAVHLDEHFRRDLKAQVKIHPGHTGLGSTLSYVKREDGLVLLANGRMVTGYSRMLPGSRTAGTVGQSRAEELAVLPGITLGDLIQSAQRENAVEWIAWQDQPGRIKLQGRKGRAEIIQHHEGLRYQTSGAEDLFEWFDDQNLISANSAGLHPEAIWLKMSRNRPCPGAPVLLNEFFQQIEPPTFIIMLREGYHLANVDQPGCGGGMTRQEVLVPVLFHGAGVKPGRIPVARLRDVAPSILNHCGISHKLPGNIYPLH